MSPNSVVMKYLRKKSLSCSSFSSPVLSEKKKNRRSLHEENATGISNGVSQPEKQEEYNNTSSNNNKGITLNSSPTKHIMSCAPLIPPYQPNKDATTETDNGDQRKTSSTSSTNSNHDRRQSCEIRRNMKSERDRLLTYVNWPNPRMDPKELAKAGFYSTQYQDAVRCAFCNVEVCRWEEGDNAMADHQRWSDNCPFVRGVDVGNIPLDPNERVELPRPSHDTCGRFGIEIRPNSVAERTEHNIDLNKLGITPSRSPAYPNYSTRESRLRTFKEWPLSIKQKPEELVDAGFFYTGKGDQTMCFSCGGGLKDWLEADDPWEQHARWFTKCSYVLMVKGRDFVTEVSQRLPAVLTAQQGAELKTEDNPKPNEDEEAASAEATTSNIKSVKLTTSNEQKQEDNKATTTKTTTTPSAPPLPNKRGEKVDDGRLCKICYMEELGVVFLPCGHIVACVKCAPSLTTCAVCRQPFTATVRAFLS